MRFHHEFAHIIEDAKGLLPTLARKGFMQLAAHRFPVLGQMSQETPSGGSKGNSARSSVVLTDFAADDAALLQAHEHGGNSVWICKKLRRKLVLTDTLPLPDYPQQCELVGGGFPRTQDRIPAPLH
jgi:hypothetical protein